VRYATPRSDLWRARLAAEMDGRGRRVALARFLADGDPARVQGQQVQVSAPFGAWDSTRNSYWPATNGYPTTQMTGGAEN
jgi:hypothetical protein